MYLLIVFQYEIQSYNTQHPATIRVKITTAKFVNLQLIIEDQRVDHIEMLRQQHAACEAIGSRAARAHRLVLLAEALGVVEQVEEALVVLAEALTHMDTIT